MLSTQDVPWQDWASARDAAAAALLLRQPRLTPHVLGRILDLARLGMSRAEAEEARLELMQARSAARGSRGARG